MKCPNCDREMTKIVKEAMGEQLISWYYSECKETHKLVAVSYLNHLEHLV